MLHWNCQGWSFWSPQLLCGTDHLWIWSPIMAVCLTLHLCIIRPAACKKKKKWFDTPNGIPTQPGMLYNEFCIAAIVRHHSPWQTEGGMLWDSIITPRPDPACVSSILRLYHYVVRAESRSVMGLITPLLCEAADGCTALQGVREKPCRPTLGHSCWPAGSLNTAQWPLGEAGGPHSAHTFLKP